MPALAALFDRMTTHVYEQRFTAQEAQAFLRNQASHLTSEDLATPIELAPRWEALENTDVIGPELLRICRTPGSTSELPGLPDMQIFSPGSWASPHVIDSLRLCVVFCNSEPSPLVLVTTVYVA